MAKARDQSRDGERSVRSAIRSGGPLPFVPSDTTGFSGAPSSGGNPMKVPRMRPIKVNPVVIQKILDKVRGKR